MEWLKERVSLLLGSGLGLGLLNFLANLGMALSDGELDSAELHSLLNGASGVQVVILAAAFLVTRKKAH